jgi:hypothetical protein
MSASVIQVIEADCSVLILRALLEKSVVAFGEDGLGKHGKCDQPKYYTIEDVSVDVAASPSSGDVVGAAFITLKGYNESDFGAILSDRNFLISIQNLLRAEFIDPNSLSYSILELQSEHVVVMDIDVPLLLDWA